MPGFVSEINMCITKSTLFVVFIRPVLSLIFIFNFSIVAKSTTEIPSIHYKKNEVFKGASCYNIIQDSKGFIWVGTSKGVFRYDGFEWEHFTIADGLWDNETYLIKEYNEEIWFMHGANGFSKFKNENFESLNELNRSLGNHIIRMSSLISFSIDGDSITIGNKAVHAFIKSDLHGNLRQIEPIPRKKNYMLSKEYEPDIKKGYSELASFLKTKNNEWVYSIRVYANKVDSINVLVDDKSMVMDTILPMNINTINTVKLIEKGNIKLLHTAHEVYKIIDNKIVNRHIINDISNINFGKDSSFFVSCSSGLFKIDKHLNIIDTILDGVPVSTFFEDREGGTWVSTLYDGLYYYPNLSDQFLNWPAAISNHGIERIGQNKILLYSDLEGIQIVDNDLIVINKIDQIGFIHSAYKAEDKNLVLIASPIDTTFIALNTEFKTFKFSRSFVEYNDELWIGRMAGIVKLNEQGILEVHDVNFTKKAKSIAITNKSIFFGATRSIFKYNFNNPSFKETIKTKVPITDLLLFQGAMLYSTYGEGFNKLDVETDENLFIKNDDISPFNVQLINANNSIYLINEDAIYLMSDLNNLNPLLIPVFNGSELNKTIRGAIIEDSSVYIRTTTGVLKTKIGINQSSLNISEIIAKKITINDKKMQSFNYEKFDNEFNNFRITYSYPFFRNKILKFRYRIDNNSDWNKLQFGQPLELINISKGTYRIEFQTMTQNGVWNKPQLIYSFTILPPFYEAWWFTILWLSFLIFIISFLFFVFYRRKKLEHELIQERNLALSSQLNPHMILNSLNGLQNLIITKKLEKAELFLVKFSRYFNSILTNAKAYNIPINDEITSVRNYLNIEGVRFEREIILNADTDQIREDAKFLKIPSFLLQPLVENSLKYGYLGNETVEIFIMFSYDNQFLKIEYSDKGKGIKGSYQPGNGMHLTEKRIKLFAKEHKGKFEFKPILNQQPGFKLTIKLPIVL